MAWQFGGLETVPGAECSQSDVLPRTKSKANSYIHIGFAVHEPKDANEEPSHSR